MSERRTFGCYDDFFAFYVRQHSMPSNRAMHAIGSVLGVAIAIAAVASGHPWFALLWPVVGYSCAWTGHFLLEHNRPATFGHPWWSFISDFRMIGLMATGRLGPWLQRSESGDPRSEFRSAK